MSWCFDFLCLNDNQDTFYQSDPSYLPPKLLKAFEGIKETNRLVAQETTEALNSDQLEVRTLESLSHEEYETIRQEGDPEHREDYLSKIVGLFVHPNRIYVRLSQSLSELERTIVHEVQHYFSRDQPITALEDEMLAVEAEDRYSGRYITRKYVRDLRERLAPDFES